LLVLDNCEHLLDPTAELVEVLERACPGVVVLATSREGLALEGERVVPVPALSAPAADADLPTVNESEAVRLFVERAGWVDPDFELTDKNASAVAQLCPRLDGLPLGIELAAARLGAMTPAELARRLDRRFDNLAGGRRRAVQCHQTLRAAIDWSYQLCSEAERRLLARLAVFAGGCTDEAAEVVCGTDPLSVGAIFELLAGLVAKSLVVAQPQGPATRYRLLETIREFGEDRLAEYGDTDQLRRRHAEFYCRLAAVLVELLEGPEQLDAGHRLSAERENLLAAVNYAIDTEDLDLALRLVRHAPGPECSPALPFCCRSPPSLGCPAPPAMTSTRTHRRPRRTEPPLAANSTTLRPPARKLFEPLGGSAPSRNDARLKCSPPSHDSSG
jgi:predicted ATPase